MRELRDYEVDDPVFKQKIAEESWCERCGHTEQTNFSPYDWYFAKTNGWRELIGPFFTAMARVRICPRCVQSFLDWWTPDGRWRVMTGSNFDGDDDGKGN